MNAKAGEQRIEQLKTQALKRKLKYGPKMTKAQCTEYLRRLLNDLPERVRR